MRRLILALVGVVLAALIVRADSELPTDTGAISFAQNGKCWRIEIAPDSGDVLYLGSTRGLVAREVACWPGAKAPTEKDGQP